MHRCKRLPKQTQVYVLDGVSCMGYVNSSINVPNARKRSLTQSIPSTHSMFTVHVQW